MKEPIWIIFEGLDGSGKTTQAKILNSTLNSHNIKSQYMHVFDSQAGRILRKVFLTNSFSSTVEALVLCATRQALLEEICPNEKEYDVIIVDRFFLSILAMQGDTATNIKIINYVRELISGNREMYTFFLNTLPEVCNRRLSTKRITDRIEKKGIEFHKQVYENYLQLVKNEKNVFTIDGNETVEKISISITKKITEIMSHAI